MHEPNKERNRVLRHGVNDEKHEYLRSVITPINSSIQKASLWLIRQVLFSITSDTTHGVRAPLDPSVLRHSSLSVAALISN